MFRAHRRYVVLVAASLLLIASLACSISFEEAPGSTPESTPEATSIPPKGEPPADNEQSGSTKGDPPSNPTEEAGSAKGGESDQPSNQSGNNQPSNQSGNNQPSNQPGNNQPNPQQASLTVVNASSVTLCYLYISPSTSSNWGSDWLGSETIQAGGQRTFSLDPGSWDLMAQDCNGNVMQNDLGITIGANGTTWTVEGAANPQDQTVALTVVNNSNATVCYLYISPTSSPNWGSDWLGSGTIASGAQSTFWVTPDTYDLKAEDCSNNVILIENGVSISSSYTWIVTGNVNPPQQASLTVVNNSGSSVCYMYISPSNSADWGSDWLGSDTIVSGGQYTFWITPDTYDLKAEDCSNNVILSAYNVSINSGYTWTITGNANPPQQASLTVVNNGGSSVCYLYISPSNSADWGSDWLGSDTITVGSQYTFWITPDTYDLKAEDCSNNVILTAYNVSINSGYTWTITGNANPPQQASLTVVNNSGSSVCYMYISPTSSSDWGSDWLGSDTITTGSQYTFWITPDTYDLKAEDCSHNVILTQNGVSISSGYTWTITGVAVPPVGDQSVALTVVNNTSSTVCYVYISPSSNSSWGSDWLGSDTIPAGGQYTFWVTPDNYDLKAEDCSNNLLSLLNGVFIGSAYTWWVQ